MNTVSSISAASHPTSGPALPPAPTAVSADARRLAAITVAHFAAPGSAEAIPMQDVLASKIQMDLTQAAQEFQMKMTADSHRMKTIMRNASGEYF